MVRKANHQSPHTKNTMHAHTVRLPDGSSRFPNMCTHLCERSLRAHSHCLTRKRQRRRLAPSNTPKTQPPFFCCVAHFIRQPVVVSSAHNRDSAAQQRRPQKTARVRRRSVRIRPTPDKTQTHKSNAHTGTAAIADTADAAKSWVI